MPTLEELHNGMFGDGKSKPTNLTCPITGSVLMDDGCDSFVMDPDHFYFSQSDESIRYARHPFCFNIFRQVERGTKNTCAKEQRLFRLNEDNSWTEMMKLPGFSDLIPLDTSEEEVNKLVREKQAEVEENKRKYEEGVANGTIDPFPSFNINIKPVTANTISVEKVVVKPMSGPSELKYLNTKYDEQ